MVFFNSQIFFGIVISQNNSHALDSTIHRLSCIRYIISTWFLIHLSQVISLSVNILSSDVLQANLDRTNTIARSICSCSSFQGTFLDFRLNCQVEFIYNLSDVNVAEYSVSSLDFTSWVNIVSVVCILSIVVYLNADITRNTGCCNPWCTSVSINFVKSLSKRYITLFSTHVFVQLEQVVFHICTICWTVSYSVVTNEVSRQSAERRYCRFSRRLDSYLNRNFKGVYCGTSFLQAQYNLIAFFSRECFSVIEIELDVQRGLNLRASRWNILTCTVFNIKSACINCCNPVFIECSSILTIFHTVYCDCLFSKSLAVCPSNASNLCNRRQVSVSWTSQSCLNITQWQEEISISFIYCPFYIT